jgi:hypothetical protein
MALHPLLRWLVAFCLTLAVEVPIAAWALSRFEPRRPLLVARCAFANLSTHPLVWFAPALLPLRGWWSIAVLELFAWAVEALFYATVFAGLPLRRAAAVSLVANAASLAAGVVLFLWLGWLS